jgi:hypothetical protein
MLGHLKFAYEVLNQTAPNQITINWTVWRQTKACITITFGVDREQGMTEVMHVCTMHQ